MNFEFALPRLLIGLPMLAVAVGFDAWYFFRCIVGIIGAYIIGRLTNYNLHSFGMLILGLFVYFIAMEGDSFHTVAHYTGIDQDILQIPFRLMGAFMIFIGFYNSED